MLRFGDAVIDIPRRQLSVDGEPRHLEPQAFDLLAYLVTHRDRVVSKPELLDEVWGDQFVSESALTTRIKEVRRALGDDGTRQSFIRNFRGRGYRFVAEPTVLVDTDESAGNEPRSPVVGREEAIAAALDAIGRSPLVTLTGPGGVGKTTLSAEVARQSQRRDGRGVHVVRLATVRDDVGLRRAFERACDLTFPSGDVDTLADAVADLDALVIIDNCEHLVAEVAQLVERITQRHGPVRLLATSRERLGIPHEQVLRVGPLDAASARTLLVARAREAHPGVAVDLDDPAIDRLLVLLDRLPLAIEMAAARLATVGADELLHVLGERLDLLRSSHRGVDARHRTLGEVIAWSERLLGSDARRLLHDLTVFEGPVTVDDVAAVVEASPAELMLGPLADLVEHSLVVAETDATPTCYQMLATVRAVVAPRRDPSVDARHARHVAAAVERADRQLRGPGEAEGVGRIRSLEAEIAGAHRWARRHDHELAAQLTTSLLHYSHERLWGEPAAWARAMLATPGIAVDVRPFAAAAAADASNRDDAGGAVQLATTALGSDEPRVAASAHDTLANVGMYTGDLDLSIEHGAAQVELGIRTGDSTIHTFGVLSGTLAHVYAGDLVAARRALGTRPTSEPLSVTSEAWLAYGVGELLAAEGDDPAAIARFHQAVALGSTVDNPFVVGVAQVAELAARARAGDIAESIRAFREILIRYRRQHDVTHGVTALRNLIVLLVRDERDEPAMQLLGALSTPAVKATYGRESALLAEAKDTAIARHGDGAVERWIAAGGVHDAGWALDAAIDLLATAADRDR